MTHGIITLACLILLALTSVVPEASAQDERSAPAEVSVQGHARGTYARRPSEQAALS
jgi:hypothetical protein